MTLNTTVVFPTSFLLLQYFKTKMSARRVSRPRIDQDMKARIMLDYSNGTSEEEIAEKYDIHVEYVRRALKSAARASMDALKVPSPSVASSPGFIKTSSEKKRKLNHQAIPKEIDFEPPKPPPLTLVRSSPRLKRGQKRKPSFDPYDDVEMSDLSTSDTSFNGNTTGTDRRSVRRSLNPSMKEAAVSPLNTRVMIDQESSAVVSTANSLTSPIKTFSRDAVTYTDPSVSYGQEYIDFLKKSHEEEITVKDEEITELKKQKTSLEKQLQQTRAELMRERERIGLERGWKKHF